MHTNRTSGTSFMITPQFARALRAAHGTTQRDRFRPGRRVTPQGSAYMRFRRALDRGNVTEALSAAAELQFVGRRRSSSHSSSQRTSRRSTSGRPLAGTFASQEVPHVDLRESQAVLALLAAILANGLAAAVLAELLSRRRSCERMPRLLSAGRGRRRTALAAGSDELALKGAGEPG